MLITPYVHQKQKSDTALGFKKGLWMHRLEFGTDALLFCCVGCSAVSEEYHAASVFEPVQSSLCYRWCWIWHLHA